MFRTIPVVGWFLVAAGGSALAWYQSLSKPQQARANEQAINYAWAMYQKKIKELTSAEIRNVYGFTRRLVG